MIERIVIIDNIDPQTFYGVNNANVSLIRNLFPKLRMAARGNVIKVIGEEGETAEFERKVKEIEAYAAKYNKLEPDIIIDIVKGGEPRQQPSAGVIIFGQNGKPIAPRNANQARMAASFRDNDLTFALGPAGTGKTYIAIALAVAALKNKEARKLILSRPAVEAGEKLGFLPGDLQSKVDPYLRPLYDALYQIMGAESFAKNMEKGLIEVAPLAYMRGRTLDNAYIILDEAQNTTPAQMKMFLTRIGFGSKVVITGDASQKDLSPGTKSGLDVAGKVLSKIEDIAFCSLTSKDVVRHPLVQKIVKAYETYEARENNTDKKRKNRNFEYGRK